jgi:hypothetical protein
MLKVKLIVLFMLCVLTQGNAQFDAKNSHLGFNVGLVSALGTHFNRFGIVFQCYGVSGFAQINASVRLYENFKSLGPKGEHTELSTSMGLCLGYGQMINEYNRILSSVGNQTRYKNSIAYSYNFYFNKVRTTQVTGTIAFQFYRFSIISENDLFAKQTLDRFRTGGFILQYQTPRFQYAVNCTMWTGRLGETVNNDSLFPGKGYLNTIGGVHQTTSHGLLSAQVKYANHFGQYLQANAGVDADQVRNVVQNKFLHSVLPGNYHIPMIDTTGNQYLYRPGQKIRKAKPFLNVYSCPNTFY